MSITVVWKALSKTLDQHRIGRRLLLEVPDHVEDLQVFRHATAAGGVPQELMQGGSWERTDAGRVVKRIDVS